MISKKWVSAYLIGIMVASIFSGMEMMDAGGANGDFGGGDGTPGNPYVIEDVMDLQNMSSNLSAYYIMKNDINASATVGWNSGSGFAPVGTDANRFTGVLDGKNYTVKGLFINRSGTDYVGLFGSIGTNGSVMNIGLLDSNITGNEYVGGLVGDNHYGTVNNSYSTGNTTGTDRVGGLAGLNVGTVNHAYATGNVTGNNDVGGLIGLNTGGTVNHSYATGNETGTYDVGGLIGETTDSTVANSYATGNVNGSNNIGGLVGHYYHDDVINNSHYNINGSLINGGCHITMGGLFQAQYQDWLSNNLSLNITDYSANLVTDGGYYDISNVQGLRDLLGFAGESDYKFRLAADIDLSSASGLYIPYLAAEFDGNDHTISNLHINLSFAAYVGMFGYNDGATIMNIGIADDYVNGLSYVGGLVGLNRGAVNNSYAAGNVTGRDDGYDGYVGGLMGSNSGGTVNNSHAAGNVTGTGWYAGGLIGDNYGTVDRSYATANVTGTNEYVGGLVGNNGEFMTVNNSYATGNVVGTSYIGGLVGINYYCGTVNNSYATGNVTGTDWYVGGLVGQNFYGTVNNSFSTGKVNGTDYVGGLIGQSFYGTANNSFSTGKVNGTNYTGGFMGFSRRSTENNSYSTGNVNGTNYVGGLIGYIDFSTLSNSYATGNVNGTANVGGLVGYRSTTTVSNSFWDKETSGRLSSAGGTGKTTAEMKTRSTFTNAGWDLTRVWCMLETVTYPILRWQDRESPTANAGPDRAIREDTLMTFNGTGSSDDLMIANYTWTFTDGAPVTLYGAQPAYRFDNQGLFIVTLNVTDIIGNRDNDTMSVTVNEITPPVADAGPDQMIDEGTLLTFNGSGSSDNVGVVNYTWTFTDAAPVTLYGVQPKHLFDKPGIFVVTLNVTDAAGNWDNDTMSVTVKDITAPVANAGPDQIVDEGNLLTFNGSGSSDNVGIKNYTWTFTDGILISLFGVQPTFKFDNPGIFIVTLNITDAAGNRDTDTMNVTANDITAPVADAGPSQTVDEGTPVKFNGNGSFDNVGTFNYTWTFSNGVPVTIYGVQSTYTFDNPGIFIVTLNVTDAAGNWGTDTMTVSVNDITAPVADAGLDQIVDEGNLLTFNASGSSDNVGIVNYSWAFTDEVPITLFGVQPAYRFDNAGVFIVTLNITDAARNWGTDNMTVTVNDMTAPVANAGPDQIVDQRTLLSFNGNGSSDNVGIVNYTWTFKDGTCVTLYGVHPACRFDNQGVFVVTLNVTDVAGNWDADTMTVTVNVATAPVADAGPDQIINEGTLLTFNGSGSSDNVGIINYTWTFHHGTDEIALYGVSPSFTFNMPGVYSVKLNVSDAAGNRHEDAMTLIVNDVTPPFADAGPDRTVPVGSTVVLNGSLSMDIGVISKCYWNFSYDGKAQSLGGLVVSFTFGKGGVYEVVLTVVDLAGNLNNDTVIITVIDVGKVIGNVLDKEGRPVEGATVEITPSDGGTNSTKTGANGSFAMDIHHGNFSWKVDKKGYRSISGNSSVNAMDETRLDLSKHPLIKEELEMIKDFGGSFNLWIILAVVMSIAIAAVGVGGYMFMKRKRTRNNEPGNR